MPELGRAYLRIGEAAHDRATAVTRARRTFLMALFHARERGDADVVAGTGVAFAALGDREVADRAAAIALDLAMRQEKLGARISSGVERGIRKILLHLSEQFAILQDRISPPRWIRNLSRPMLAWALAMHSSTIQEEHS